MSALLLTIALLVAPFPDAIMSGQASWYNAGPGLYAAVPGFRAGHPYTATVRRGNRTVHVRVVTSCGCPHHRIIDLSPLAFTRLGGSLSAGVMRVIVSRP